MYERFNIYVSEKTLYKLRDLFNRERKNWVEDSHENGELICLCGEFESRVQHLQAELWTRGKKQPDPPPVDDWLR